MAIVLEAKIHSQADIHATFVHTNSFKRLMSFIEHISSQIHGQVGFVAPESAALSRPEAVLKTLLDELKTIADETPPLQSAQRFGNKAFAVFHAAAKHQIANTLAGQPIPAAEQQELTHYLSESFGSSIRIDYGTGHELSFIIFLMCFHKQQPMQLLPSTHNVGHSLTAANASCAGFDDGLDARGCIRVFKQYLDLVHLLHIKYRMEPAGSHGVWGLDDFHHLPYYFGSAQLIRTGIAPASYLDERARRSRQHADLFHYAVCYVCETKRGAFHEHSPMLYDISAAPSWEKIHAGLHRMYISEVLTKLPVVRHLNFGLVFPYD